MRLKLYEFMSSDLGQRFLQAWALENGVAAVVSAAVAALVMRFGLI